MLSPIWGITMSTAMYFSLDLLRIILQRKQALFVPGSWNSGEVIKHVAAMIETHSFHPCSFTRKLNLRTIKRVMKLPGLKESSQEAHVCDSDFEPTGNFSM
jgi:hypothetical protein